MSIDSKNSIQYRLPKYLSGKNQVKSTCNSVLTASNSNYRLNNYIKYDTLSLTSNSLSNSNKAVQLRAKLNKTKEEQGLIGKAWDGIKNLFGMKAGSSNVEKIISKLENGEISEQEAQQALTKYQDGQKMCVDVVGDMVSGILAVGCAIAAPFTGGASLLLAAGVGAGCKVGIKGLDSAVGGRKYGIKDFGYDLITGSINGAMAPLTNAIGGAAGTGVAKICGLNAGKIIVKETGEEVLEQTAKQTGKSFLTNLLAKQGTEYVAKVGAKAGLKTTMAKVAAYGVDMAVDGALGGATDGFARSLADCDFENMRQNVTDGFKGGLIAAPLIGGGFRLAGKAGSKIGSKIFNKTTLNTTANNADGLISGMSGATELSGLTITTKEMSENISESLSDGATRQISDGIAEVVSNPTSDIIVREAVESIPDGTLTKIPNSAQKINPESLKRGVDYLINDANPADKKLVSSVVEESFVSIKTETEAIDLFKARLKDLSPDETLIILNPTPESQFIRGQGTSNSYMTDLYQQATGNRGIIANCTNIQKIIDEAITQNKVASDGKIHIKIAVPDDFSGSGCSLLLNMANLLKNSNVPDNVALDITLSPLAATPKALKVFESFGEFDLDKLLKNISLSEEDTEIASEFFTKFQDRLTISADSGIIEVTPYYETPSYIKMNQSEKDFIDIVMTGDGEIKNLGYSPKGKNVKDGGNGTLFIGIKRKNDRIGIGGPNNNCEGVAVFALLEGVSVDLLKSPAPKKFKAWKKLLEEIKNNIEL